MSLNKRCSQKIAEGMPAGVDNYPFSSGKIQAGFPNIVYIVCWGQSCNFDMSQFYRPKPFVPDAYIPKWSREILQEGFTPFPKRLIRCLGQVFYGENAVERLQVVLAIADAKRLPKEGVAYRPPTLNFLAFNAGMTEYRFEGLIRQLQFEGLVTVLDPDPKHFEVDLSPLLSRIENLTPEGS